MLRKTKIICTLGPAVDSEEHISALIKGGMNGARFSECAAVFSGDDI